MENTKEYEPFGNEWKNEVMKMRKADLVELLKNAYLENLKTKNQFKK